MITPQIHVDSVAIKTKVIFFKTYHNHLKKNIKRNFGEYGVKQLLVIRSRRGQWGEWWERWEIDHRCEPFIVKEGWS